MHRKMVFVVWLVFWEFIFSSGLYLYASPMENWQKLMSAGSCQKFEGQYDAALQSFKKALTLAESGKLPNKCLLISLCRVADVEVTTNKIDVADKHSLKVIDLIKEEKATNTLDPQVSFWAAVLSDAYVSNTKPETREDCLQRACKLKEVIYGASHKEFLECAYKLVACYIDRGKVAKAVRILTLSRAMADTKAGAKLGRNSDALGETFNHLALNCETAHQYAQAKQLELAAIKEANSSTGDLRMALPAFYSFLGMNALGAQERAQSKAYFACALSACATIKTAGQKKAAAKYQSLLIEPISTHIQARPNDAQTEIRHLMTVEQIIAPDKNASYALYTLLAAALLCDPHCKAGEYAKCINSAIAIASMPNSSFVNDIPDLYMRLGLAASGPGRGGREADAFTKALDSENDKHGYHAVLVRFWWGWRLWREGKISLAAEKLDMTLPDAKALLSSKRGTVLADILQLRAQVAQADRRVDLEKILSEQSASEIRLQKKLNSQLGPDFYHRMQK